MKNKEQTLNTMFSTIDKTIAIKQPKLLKINNNYNNNSVVYESGVIIFPYKY